ncbi:MAG: GDP-L-fucose synthase [Ignavibacteriales bacterium]|nr:MAG: GDP-L-fucose synthase [Ignavibacteriales bacterium]
MDKNSKIMVAGHKGMVGSAIVRELSSRGYVNLATVDRNEADLRNQQQVFDRMESASPEVVVIAAAKVGGIMANNIYRGEFLYDNLMIEANLIEASRRVGVKKLLFLGSSCIYPKFAEQPIREESLLTGTLEFTNEPYAIAKITGIKLCESYYRQYGCNYFSAMPTNLYGPGDNFDLEKSHVLPALMRKFHEAKAAGKDHVMVWGTGTVLREFMYVEDLASALAFLLENVDAKDIYEKEISHINIGTGSDVTISALAELVKDITGYKGKIIYDTSKPDGTPRKLMDSSRLHELGWESSVSLEEGIRRTYKWFLENIETIKR